MPWEETHAAITSMYRLHHMEGHQSLLSINNTVSCLNSPILTRTKLTFMTLEHSSVIVNVHAVAPWWPFWAGRGHVGGRTGEGGAAPGSLSKPHHLNSAAVLTG